MVFHSYVHFPENILQLSATQDGGKGKGWGGAGGGCFPMEKGMDKGGCKGATCPREVQTQSQTKKTGNIIYRCGMDVVSFEDFGSSQLFYEIQKKICGWNPYEFGDKHVHVFPI